MFRDQWSVGRTGRTPENKKGAEAPEGLCHFCLDVSHESRLTEEIINEGRKFVKSFFMYAKVVQGKKVSQGMICGK